MSLRINIGSIRRGQIVDAAWAIIAEQGLQKLSLSEIEKKVKMSRGQLTYYFKSKEDILLAVFDRLMEQCQQRGKPGDGDPHDPLGRATWEEVVAWILNKVVKEPSHKPEFHALHYTFLAQISHRADFRARLARLYEDWRRRTSEHLAETLKRRPAQRKFSPRAFATVVQAMIGGLAVQAAVDPRALAGDEAVAMCLDMLQTYLWPRGVRRQESGDRRQETGVRSQQSAVSSRESEADRRSEARKRVAGARRHASRRKTAISASGNGKHVASHNGKRPTRGES